MDNFAAKLFDEITECSLDVYMFSLFETLCLFFRWGHFRPRSFLLRGLLGHGFTFARIEICFNIQNFNFAISRRNRSLSIISHALLSSSLSSRSWVHFFAHLDLLQYPEFQFRDQSA